MKRDTNLLIRINSSLKKEIQDIARRNNVSVSDIINQSLIDIASKGDLSSSMKSKLKVDTNSNLSIDLLKRHINEVLDELGLKNKVLKVYLFGSVSRGEATSKSDVDLRFETTNDISMFDIGNIRYYLKKKTGRDVDITNEDPNNMDPSFYRNIKKDEICVYENK